MRFFEEGNTRSKFKMLGRCGCRRMVFRGAKIER
jgi:hypothetical protein